MPFVQLDDQIASHPKIVRAGPAAAWMWAAAIAYCNRHLTDGLVPLMALTTLGPFKNPKAMADHLVEARKPGGVHGLFERRGEDYAVHDYLEHNPTAKEVLRRRAEAAAKKARQRGLSPGDNQGDTSGDIPRDTHRDTGGTDTGTPEGTPPGQGRDSRGRVPTPTPTPTPTSDENSERSVARAPAVRAREETPAMSALIPASRGATLLPPAPKNTLWPGRPPVADFVHADLRQRLGPQHSEQDLFAFYERTAAAWIERPIAEDAPRFWRARFAEWQGGGSPAATKRQAISAQNDAALRAVLSRGKAER